MKRKATFATITLLSLALAGTGVLAMGGHGDKGKGPRMDFEQVDTNGDGKLSREELAAVAAGRFAAADADGDGKITAEEVGKASAMRAEKRFGRMLERHDADGDGAISLEEMQAGPRHAKMFDRLDADEDGFISKQEMQTMRGKYRGHGHKGARHGDDN